MRKIRETLRLYFEAGLSRRAVGRCLHIATATVSGYLERLEKAGLAWPLPDELTDAELERRLFPVEVPKGQRPVPDWNVVHRELRRAKNVTLRLLWLEYKEKHPEGFQYSWFCQHYRQWQSKLDLVMRQTHRAGEKLFIDYAGETVAVVDPLTGEKQQAQIFVAVLGASNYTFAEATWTQTLPDWIASHQRAFTFFGGVPEILVPDNLKSGVTRAHRYEPDLNPTYADMAAHYGVAVIPARPYAPRDKAKAENAVLVVERWILARLRNHTFFSLEELNRVIGELLTLLNEEPFQKLPGSRRSLFEELDRPALRALPRRAYEFARWKKLLVGLDYHVDVDGHYYSVPYRLVRHIVEVRITEAVVECFFGGVRVASHVKSDQVGGQTTVEAHRPPAHRHWAGCDADELRSQAQKTGAATTELVEHLLTGSSHPQQGLRSSLAVMRLSKSYGPERLEAACRRALAIEACSFRSVASILKTGLDTEPLPLRSSPEPVPLEHCNIRGAAYYH
jgi:transposase